MYFDLVCLRSRGPPGGPRRPREGPRRAQGDLPEASRGSGARVKKIKNLYLLQGLTERPSYDLAPTIYGPEPYKFIGLGGIYGPKPYKFIGSGGIYGPKPYKFIGFGGICLFS